MVAITKAIQSRLDGEERILAKMYDQMNVGETYEWMSIRKAIEMFGEPEGTISNALIVFDDLGILGRSIEYPGFQKQNVKWTLLMPRKEAYQTLKEWHRQIAASPEYLKFPKHVVKERVKKSANGSMPSEPTREEARVAVSHEPASEGRELVASAGPEAPSPFAGLRVLRKDESKAVVAAARQYADKATFLEKKIAELRAEGFEIAEGALSIKRDERLESVALALPYIDSLESMNTRLINQGEGHREAVRQLEDLRGRYTRLQRENERLLARQVGDSARVTSG